MLVFAQTYSHGRSVKLSSLTSSEESRKRRSSRLVQRTILLGQHSTGLKLAGQQQSTSI